MTRHLADRMRMLSLTLLAIVASFQAQTAAGLQPCATGSVAGDSACVAAWWDAHHVVLPPPPLVTHAIVQARLRDVQAGAPDLFSLEQVGQSGEGRAIYHLWFGRGPTKVLIWSQMHGDEPTATSALFDLIKYVAANRTAPEVARMLDALSIHIVPMLNPDGAERYHRRNAQSIDVNRDALLAQTPEGRALKALRDRLNPAVGFNLHNQNWRTSVGRPARPASISLLAVAYDDLRTESEGRRLTKRLCAVIRDAIEPFAPNQVGRYDDSFEVRAFGDNVTRWGTSVVLIETGPWPSAEPDPPLVRLNFVGLVSALDALATGRVNQADPARYESLPLNDERLFHTLVRNATIVPGTGVAPFTADVGIVATRSVNRSVDPPALGLTARIDDVGDLRVFGALDVIDASGLVLTPAFSDAARVGDRVALPDWKESPPPSTIAVGQPAQLFLLAADDSNVLSSDGVEPSAGGAAGYRIARIINLGSPVIAASVKAFTDARLFDGTGRAPVAPATIVVADGRIVTAGPADTITIPDGAERIDLSGKMVVPGLVNAHGHVGETRGLESGPQFYTRENVIAQLELYARYGVTSVFSLGGDQAAGASLRGEQQLPSLSHARLFIAGPVVDKTTPAEAMAMVDEVAALRPDWIKIRVDDNLGTTAKMPAAAWGAVVARAHEHSLPLAAHVFYLDDAVALAEAGADLIGHSVRDRPVDGRLLAALRRRNVCVSPTLTRELSTFVYRARPGFFDDPFFLRGADRDTVRALSTPSRQAAVAQNAAAKRYEEALPLAKRNLKALADAGVRIAFGTDSGPPGRFQGYFEHLELEMMVQAGLTPLQALVAATGDAAHCMGQAGAIGTITPGAWADLLVLNADPLVDIRNTRAIDSVWIAGRRLP